MEDIEQLNSHSFNMVLRRRVERLSEGNVCVYSYERSLLQGHLWKFTVLPTNKFLSRGLVERLSIDGNILSSEWHSAEAAVKKCFTECVEVESASTSKAVVSSLVREARNTEAEIKIRTKSFTFTLRGEGLEQMKNKEKLEHIDCSSAKIRCLVKTGPVKPQRAYICVFGVVEPADSDDFSIVPDLLSITQMLRKVFGYDMVVHASYCHKNEDWKEFAGIQ